MILWIMGWLRKSIGEGHLGRIRIGFKMSIAHRKTSAFYDTFHYVKGKSETYINLLELSFLLPFSETEFCRFALLSISK